jgi:hypothetical protein
MAAVSAPSCLAAQVYGQENACSLVQPGLAGGGEQARGSWMKEPQLMSSKNARAALIPQ